MTGIQDSSNHWDSTISLKKIVASGGQQFDTRVLVQFINEKKSQNHILHFFYNTLGLINDVNSFFKEQEYIKEVNILKAIS